MLPALERLAVLVSRLRGLSKFQVSNINLGLSTRDLENVLDTVDCLQLVAHRILITAGLELRQFQAFSSWLRQEIDAQATDPSSSESSEKDVNIDYASALDYIRGPMMQSQLMVLLNLSGHEDTNLQWDLVSEGRSLFELYKRELKSTSHGEHPAKRIPGLNPLVKHLTTQCDTVFSKIAETQRRYVRFSGPVAIGAGMPACMDMTTLVEVRHSTGTHAQSNR